MQQADNQPLDFLASDLDTRLAPLAKRLHLGLTAMIDTVLADLSLTATQFSALVLLEVAQAGSASEVARRIGISDQAAGGLIDRLVARGAVERQAHPNDRRRHALSVTPAGRALLAEAVGRVNAAEASVLEGLKASDRTALMKGLGAAVDRVDGWREAR
jgi:DNA-binding MarR family transcriptional regulator